MSDTLSNRSARMVVIAAALVVAGGNLTAVWLARAAFEAGQPSLLGPVICSLAILAAGWVLRPLAGSRAMGLAIVMAATVMAASWLLLPDHPELLSRLLPVIGGGAGGAVVIQPAPRCRRQTAS